MFLFVFGRKELNIDIMSSLLDKNQFSTICRLCMDKLLPKNANVKRSAINMLEVIEEFTTIKIDPSDNLPQNVCESCIQTIDSMLAFQNKCKRTNEELHKMVEKIDDREDHLNGSLGKDESSDDDGAQSPLDNTDDDECRSETVDALDGQVSAKETNVSKVKCSRPGRIACHICGKLYFPYEMKYHINKHNGLKPFACTEPNCTSKFTDPQSLSFHKKLSHLMKPVWFCDVCGKGFKVKARLDMHRSYHFDPTLPCKICKKLFRNKRAIGKHMLVHQERKFKCETCGKDFQTGYTLRIHMRVHTQEKPYSCHCGLSFAHKCLLKSHTEKYHK